MFRLNCHHVAHHSPAVHEGHWENQPDFCFRDYPLIEPVGKTMGVIGCDRIGQTTGKLAQAFGIKVIAFDAMREVVTKLGNCIFVELDELFKTSDVIALPVVSVDTRNYLRGKYRQDERRRDNFK